MQSFNTLIRRTAAALGAIAALTVTGIATSQTVTLSSGGSCTYSQMTVTPNGNVSVTCATSSGPGVFGITAPTNLATGAVTSGTTVRITRTSGSSGAVEVAFQLSGSSSCTTSSGTSVTFADGDTAPKGIIVSAGANPGTCVIGITPAAPATVSGSGTATINIVDADAPVEFVFQSSIIAANVGSSATAITATRTGGTNGAWTVPFTLSGDLASPLRGSFSATQFTFPPGSSTATVTYTPPATTPASPPLPATMELTLATPQPGVPAPSPSQTASLGTVTVATLTLNGPAVGCPAETTITPLLANGSVNHLRVPSGQIVTYNLPTALSGPNGVFGLYETTYTAPNSPFTTELHINKCKGLVQAPAAGTTDGCYISSGSIATIQKVWMTALTSKLPTPAAVSNAGRCYAPPAQGPWYVNVKFTYASCKTAGNCGWHAVWKDYSSY